MKFRAMLAGASLAIGSPVLAWSGGALAGDYRFVAQVDANKLQSVSLAPQSGRAEKPMQLHAWFVDREGAILGQAPLTAAPPSGPTLIALGRNTPIPTGATALVILAQPAGATPAAMATQPALVAQIALR